MENFMQFLMILISFTLAQSALAAETSAPQAKAPDAVSSSEKKPMKKFTLEAREVDGKNIGSLRKSKFTKEIGFTFTS